MAHTGRLRRRGWRRHPHLEDAHTAGPCTVPWQAGCRSTLTAHIAPGGHMDAKGRECHERYSIDHDSTTHRIVCGQSSRYLTYQTMGRSLVIPVRMVPRRENVCVAVCGPLVRVWRVGLVVPCLALISVVGHDGNRVGRVSGLCMLSGNWVDSG